MKNGLKWRDRLLLDAANYIYAAVIGFGADVQLIVYREKRIIDLGRFSSVDDAKTYAEKAV